MMGSNDKPQNQLFYSFNLDEVVPEDHLLRHIDRFCAFRPRRTLIPMMADTIGA